MKKCQSSKRSGKTLSIWLSSGEWHIALVVLTILRVSSSHGCFRLIGRVARRPVQTGVEVVENLAPVPRQTKLLPDLRAKDPKVNPLDRDPSDAIHLVQLDAQRQSSSLDLPPAPVGQRSETTIQTSATVTSQRANQLREWVRNGGRSFSRTLGSFPSYSRRTLRTIHMRWRSFREAHPAATKYAKWASWLSEIAVSIGSAMSLPLEFYRTFHGLRTLKSCRVLRTSQPSWIVCKIKVCRNSNRIQTRPSSICIMRHSHGLKEDPIDLGLKTFQD